MKLNSIIPAPGGKKLRNVTEGPNTNKDYWQSSAKENIYALIRTNPLYWSDEAILQEARIKFNLYFLPFILENGIDSQKADVLEIGCGIGRFGYHIAPLVHSYTGVDFVEEYLSKAESILRDYKNCTLILNDGLTLEDVEDESQDLVLSYAVFAYVHDSKITYSYLKETIRVLKREGIAKLEIKGANSTPGYKSHWVNVGTILYSRQKDNYFKKCIKSLLTYLPQDFQILTLRKQKYEVKEGTWWGEGIPSRKAIEFVESLGAFATVSPRQSHDQKDYSSNLSNWYWLYIYKDKNREVIRA